MLKDLEKKFEDFLGTSVEIKITENTTSLISVAKKIDKIIIKMNKNFLHADEGVFSDILSFVKNGDKNTPNLRNFIKSNLHLLKKNGQKLNIRTKGKIYNLEEIFELLNKKYFENSLRTKITWGKVKNGFVKKRILGSYDQINDIIRINPVLDRPSIPFYYIYFVVYHEVLHAFLKNTEKRWHGKKFKSFEKNFEYYEEAIKWEKRQK
jgi:predicted metal-dependent hydrolase